MGVRGAGAFEGNVTANMRNDIGKVVFNAFQVSANPQAPLTLVQLAPKLTGSSAVSYGLQVSFSVLADAAGGEVPQDAAKTMSLRRGDARVDGNLTIVDALFIAQYLAGIRNARLDPLTEVHAVNAASVRLDDTGGDKITITDALLIAQKLVGIRDDRFNLIP